MTETPPGMPPARVLWIIAGLSFFVAGVIFTLVTPDNVALGISFLGLGVVFFSLSSTLAGVGGGGGDGGGGDGGGGDGGGGSDGGGGVDSTGDEPDEGGSPQPPRD